MRQEAQKLINVSADFELLWFFVAKEQPMRCMVLIILLIVISSTPSLSQDAIGARDAEKFAVELASSTAAKRTDMLAAQPERITVALRRELIQQGNLRFASTQYAQALEIYQLVEKISQQIGDKEGLAATWLNMGSVYYFQAKYDDAIEHYRKAEAAFAALDNRVEVGRCRFGIALTYQSQRKPTEAIKKFEEALKDFEAARNTPEIANTLASIGGLHYELGNYEAARQAFLRVVERSPGGDSLLRLGETFYMQHDYSQALNYYLQALEYLKPQNSSGGMIAAYSGAANCYYYQRNYDRALEFYNRSLAIEQRLDDPNGVATRLQSIGNVHRVRGDYVSALESYTKSLAIAQQLPTSGTVATTLGSIGLIRSMQGDNAQALEYFDKSLARFQTDGDHVGMARMLAFIGNARYVQGQYDLALEAYEKSRELYEQRSDELNRAHVLLGTGAVYLAQRNYAEALKSFHEALTSYMALGRKADVADALSRLASAYREQGDNGKALEFAQNATQAAKDAEVFAVASYALTEAGRAQRGLGRKSEALNSFAQAIQVQRSIRPETGPDGIEADRSGTLPYLSAMETLIELDQPREALVRADEAKSQLLRELISRGNFTISKGMSAPEREEELRLAGALAALKTQVYGSQDSNVKQTSTSNDLKTRLSAARAAYEAFRKRLYTRHPQLAINRGELAALSIEELRPFVNSNTALLQYAVSDDKVFLFVVTAIGSRLDVKVYALNTPRVEIAQEISSLRQSLDNDEAPRALYDMLLRPAEPQIESKAKLIIVPDGPLWDVPFEALIDHAAVSYAVSFSALREMRKRRVPRRAAQMLVAFANPTLKNEVIERLQRTYTGLKLAATESTEIEKLKTLYGPKGVRTYTATQANKERLRTEANTATVLHLATPAILDQSVPMYSLFLMSPDAADDGLLKLWEITNLNSKARVLVLPHVSTPSQSGNALIALSWAWFVAGCPAVVLNRWSGNDGFLYDLHERLKTNEPDSEQLRQATLKFKRSAGYIYLGYGFAQKVPNY